MAIKHYDIIVTGQVQGVGYRYEAQRVARFMGIRGYVQNKNDGTVYVEAEAEESLLIQFVNWCRTGSRHARVDDVHVTESKAKGLAPFGIRY